MTKRLIMTNTKLSLRIAGALFATLGGLMALFALTAQTPTPSPLPSGQCKDWPPCRAQVPGDCDQVHEKVKKVFTDLMDEASKNETPSRNLRKKLIDKANGYEKAKTEVRGRLQRINIPFGNEHTVIFYIPELRLNNPGEPGTMAKYPNNHCIHVFHLPDVPTSATEPAITSVFKEHLMCCYQPWAPESR
jgi:hypothetical protein